MDVVCPPSLSTNGQWSCKGRDRWQGVQEVRELKQWKVTQVYNKYLYMFFYSHLGSLPML